MTVPISDTACGRQRGRRRQLRNQVVWFRQLEGLAPGQKIPMLPAMQWENIE